MESTEGGNKTKIGKSKAPPRLPKPDRSSYEARVAEIQALCDASQSRIDAIKVRIEAKRSGRRIGDGNALPSKSKLQDVRDQFKSVLNEKNAEKNRLAAMDKSREGLRSDIKSIKDKLPFTSVEKIDEEIKRIEDLMSHSSLSLNEEKRLMAQIQNLSRSKDLVKEYVARTEKLGEDDAMRKSCMEKIKEYDVKLNALKEEEKEQKKIRDAEREKADAETSNISAMHEERNKHYQTIKDLRKELKDLRTEFKEKEDAYYAAERAFNAYVREERKRRWEAMQEERQKRDEEHKKQMEEMAPDPFDEEIIICDQLYHYVSKWIISDKGVVSAEINEVETMLDGMVLKKRDDDEENFSYGLSSSKGGKKNKKNKQDKQERLVHSIDVVSSFHKVGVEVPNLASECSKAAETLLQKKEHYTAEREAAIARKLAEKEDPPPASKAGTDDPEAEDADVSVRVTVDDAKSVAVSLEVGDDSGASESAQVC